MNLFVFGPGYASRAFVKSEGGRFASIAATARSKDSVREIVALGARPHLVADDALDDSGRADLARATHALVSIPPDASGDPALRILEREATPALRWIGYLSSVAVYGDRRGGWVDEDDALDATSVRGRWRIAAERAWLGFGVARDAAAHVFRLAGIYGPGRNALVNLRAGTAKRIVKPGQVFNRIHVDDIARIVAATLNVEENAVWNVADDEPAPPQDVVAYAAKLLGVAAPPESDFDPKSMSPMAASFYSENRRIVNQRIKEKLGLSLLYPTYREGLAALLLEETR